MRKEYLTFIDNPKDMPVGQEVEITVKDLTEGRQKYDGRNVKAIVSDSPDSLPDSDVLWIRSLTGVLYPQPWAIRIVSELGEFIPQRPYSDYKLSAQG